VFAECGESHIHARKVKPHARNADASGDHHRLPLCAGYCFSSAAHSQGKALALDLNFLSLGFETVFDLVTNLTSYIIAVAIFCMPLNYDIISHLELKVYSFQVTR
jgi:hypothetical protein